MILNFLWTLNLYTPLNEQVECKNIVLFVGEVTVSWVCLLQQVAVTSPAAWIISPTEQATFDEMFKIADLDKDGFVNGTEIKDVFIQSGVPQAILAHIWQVLVFCMSH